MTTKTSIFQTLLASFFVILVYFTLIYFVAPLFNAFIDIAVPIYWKIFGSNRLADVDNPGFIQTIFIEAATASFCSFFALCVAFKFPRANFKIVLIIFSLCIAIWTSSFIWLAIRVDDFLLGLIMVITDFLAPMAMVLYFWKSD